MSTSMATTCGEAAGPVDVVSWSLWTEMVPHRQVLPDAKVLRFDVTQVELVGEVVVKVGHHVQEAQGNPMDHLSGGPPVQKPGSVWSRDNHLLQGEDVLVPGVSSRQELHRVEVTTGTQNLGHMDTEALQNPGEDQQQV